MGPPECAVSVSVTDWGSDQQNAPTEDGVDGFSFRADQGGTLTLVAEFTSQVLLNILHNFIYI